jgi:hypothetical protein
MTTHKMTTHKQKPENSLDLATGSRPATPALAQTSSYPVKFDNRPHRPIQTGDRS